MCMHLLACLIVLLSDCIWKPVRVEKCAKVLLWNCSHSSLWGLFRQSRNSELISIKSSGLVAYGSSVIYFLVLCTLLALMSSQADRLKSLRTEIWSSHFQYFMSTAIVRLLEMCLAGMMSVSYRKPAEWYNHHQYLNKMPSFMPLYRHNSLVSHFSLSKITIMEKWFHQ